MTHMGSVGPGRLLELAEEPPALAGAGYKVQTWKGFYDFCDCSYFKFTVAKT